MASKTSELKRGIEETFDIEKLDRLEGLAEELKKMGRESTAADLEQLIRDEKATGNPPVS